MEKFNLPNSIPISLWNPETPETILFVELFCEENLKEMKFLLKTLDETHQCEQKNIIKEMKTLYDESYKIWTNVSHLGFQNTGEDVIYLLHDVITKCPKECDTLRSALTMRGDMFINAQEYEKGICDYEMLIYLISTDPKATSLDELNAVTALYEKLDDLDKFKLYLNKFKHEYNRQIKLIKNKKILKKKGPGFIEKLKAADMCIEKFAVQLKSFIMRSETPSFTIDNSKFTPYHGYKGNKDERISMASAACSLVVKNNLNTVVANRSIPENQIIIYEPALEINCYSPNKNCDCCFKPISPCLSYSCLTCRFKTYCTLKCLKSDEYLHKYECAGFQSTLFCMLNATVYRLFIKSLQHLKKYVFNKINRANDVHDFFQEIMNEVENSPQSQIKKVLVTIPNYEKISQNELITMITHSFRITIFVVEKTSIIDDFFENIQLKKKELRIFIASLLLRLQVQLKFNSIEMRFHQYNGQNSENIDFEYPNIYKFSKKVNQHISIYDYTSQDKGETDKRAELLLSKGTSFDIKDSILLNSSSSSSSSSTINNEPNNSYLIKFNRVIADKLYLDIINNYLDGKTKDFNLQEKARIISNFASTYLRSLSEQYRINANNLIVFNTQLIQGLYPVTKKFQHSCDPNIIIIFLESGAIVGKSIRDIKPNEELLICYGPTYKDKPKLYRRLFHERCNFECHCFNCESDIDFFNANNTIICCRCHVPITNDVSCPQCSLSKTTVQALYDQIFSNLDKKDLSFIKEKDKVQYIQHVLLRSRIHSFIYPETSQESLNEKIRFMKICAVNNFVYDIANLLPVISNQIDFVFSIKSTKIMMYYFEILSILYDLLTYNFNYNYNSIRFNTNEYIEIFKVYILWSQKLINMYDFYEIQDDKSMKILHNYHIIKTMRKKIFECEISLECLNEIESNENKISYDMPNLFDYIDDDDNMIILDSDNNKLTSEFLKEFNSNNNKLTQTKDLNQALFISSLKKVDIGIDTTDFIRKSKKYKTDVSLDTLDFLKTQKQLIGSSSSQQQQIELKKLTNKENNENFPIHFLNQQTSRNLNNILLNTNLITNRDNYIRSFELISIFLKTNKLNSDENELNFFPIVIDESDENYQPIEYIDETSSLNSELEDIDDEYNDFINDDMEVKLIFITLDSCTEDVKKSLKNILFENLDNANKNNRNNMNLNENECIKNNEKLNKNDKKIEIIEKHEKKGEIIETLTRKAEGDGNNVNVKTKMEKHNIEDNDYGKKSKKNFKVSNNKKFNNNSNNNNLENLNKSKKNSNNNLNQNMDKNKNITNSGVLEKIIEEDDIDCYTNDMKLDKNEKNKKDSKELNSDSENGKDMKEIDNLADAFLDERNKKVKVMIDDVGDPENLQKYVITNYFTADENGNKTVKIPLPEECEIHVIKTLATFKIKQNSNANKPDK